VVSLRTTRAALGNYDGARRSRDVLYYLSECHAIHSDGRATGHWHGHRGDRVSRIQEAVADLLSRYDHGARVQRHARISRGSAGDLPAVAGRPIRTVRFLLAARGLVLRHSDIVDFLRRLFLPEV